MKHFTWDTVRVYLAGQDADPATGREAKPGAWPRQFSTAYCTPDDLAYFREAVHKLVGGENGLSWEQVYRRLLYLRNESEGGPKLNRNEILNDLRDLRRQEIERRRGAKPVALDYRQKRERPAHPAMSAGSPTLRALRDHADPADAIAACPWLGRPSSDGRYPRNIDRPMWRDMHDRFHGRQPQEQDHAAV